CDGKHHGVGERDGAREQADSDRYTAAELHDCEQRRPEPAGIEANALDKACLREGCDDFRPTLECKSAAHEKPQDQPTQGLCHILVETGQGGEDQAGRRDFGESRCHGMGPVVNNCPYCWTDYPAYALIRIKSSSTADQHKSVALRHLLL